MSHRTEPSQRDRYICCSRKHRYRDGQLQPCPVHGGRKQMR